MAVEIMIIIGIVLVIFAVLVGVFVTRYKTAAQMKH